jgi:Holliday junction resolvase
MIDGSLRQLFREHLPHVHWQAIETGGTGRGIPDLNGCFAGIEVWIELKRMVGRRVLMRPEQVAWIERRARAGGRVFIAVRKGKEQLFLVGPTGARHLLENRFPAVLGRWSGGPRAWNWAEITTILFGTK